MGAHLKLGVDGISLWLVLLTTFLTPIVLLSTHTAVNKKVREFVAAILILETGMLGALLAIDLFLFYIFWEVMLIPMYLLIGIWGGDRRVYASIKFVIYTMVGSLLMLVAILYLYVQYGSVTGDYTFDLEKLHTLVLPHGAQMWCFAAFGLAFAIKVPLFPLHTWLPDAHVEAPTAGSVILAGVLLKFGIYGFLRFALPLFPYGALQLGPYLAMLAVAGIIYGAAVAYVQEDVKKLVAYSSVSHLGFCVLGLLALNHAGVEGSIFAMLSHGLTTGGLFLAIGMIYERRHTRRMAEFGGLWKQMPIFGGLFLIVTLGSVGLPGLSGFVGEFLTLFGAFQSNESMQVGAAVILWKPKFLVIVAALGVIIGAVYLLYMFQKMMFGPLDNDKNKELKDLSGREIAVFVPLVVMIFVMGLFPRPFLNKMDKSVERFQKSYTEKLAQPNKPEAFVYQPSYGPRVITVVGDDTTGPPAAATAGAGEGNRLVLAEAFATGKGRAFLMRLSVAGSVLAAVAAIYVWGKLGGQPRSLMGGMLVADNMSCFLLVLFSAITALTALASADYLREHDFEIGEFYAVLMLSATGMGILAMAGDLVSVFIGIETMSIGAYVLIASRRRSRRSAEAAMKYFLMGAFATGFLLYGIALIYGATGTTNLAAIGASASAYASEPLLILGMFFLLVAFGFKVAAVPFHMWTPDAYEGAPTPVTGFMASGVKAAAFAGIVRVFAEALGGDVLPYGYMGWAGFAAAAAALTMTIGNVAALRQENVKRMLAYSSIAHAGTMLVAVAAMGVGAGTEARPALLYYLAAYSLTTLGAFAVASWIGSRGDERTLIDDWSGLAQNHPGAALAMTVFMLSLAGLPPLAGFFGKFYIFKAAMAAQDNQLMWLVVVGVLNSVISVFYYLRLVTAMYFRDPLREHKPLVSPATVFAFVVCALLVLQMGLFPSFWLGKAF
jgi:proton-translocating NADH-quinone oxidoreductase chain M/proton-translocating NADH-quinone oxidoreductase chain N